MSFYRDGIVEKSTVLHSVGVCHGFSTRAGGVSILPHTASMNVAEGHGDTAETVQRNIDLLATAVSSGTMGAECVICAPQVHSATIFRVGRAEAGCGVLRPTALRGDGFITDEAGVLLMIRMADCVPILFTASRSGGDCAELVAAVHAGWCGTAAGIAAEAVRQLLELGARKDSIRCAIGQAIHECCYEVQEDFVASVAELRGRAFADAHIRRRDGKFWADVPGMNRSILLACGMAEWQIDMSPHCTACAPTEFHSHRASGGMRGAMGAVIGLIES